MSLVHVGDDAGDLLLLLLLLVLMLMEFAEESRLALGLLDKHREDILADSVFLGDLLLRIVEYQHLPYSVYFVWKAECLGPATLPSSIYRHSI